MSLSETLGVAQARAALEHELFLASPDGETVATDSVLEFLARLRMLEGVPFNTLVPDADFLPVESIRFFYLDRAWTDALVQGALSVGTANSLERAQLEKLYPKIEEEIDEAERRVRSPGSEPTLTGTAGVVTGFLMRSAAVAGWPGMHIRAYDTEPADHDEEVLPESNSDRIKLLRLERLAPSVILALFDGIPNVLHIEEPRQGLQFGVRLEEQSSGRWRAFVPARDVRTAGYVDDAGAPVVPDEDDPTAPSTLAAQIPVRFRRGAAGVLDLSNTARAFADADGTGMTAPIPGEDFGEDIDGAEFAMQMLRFPYRQVFAQSTTTPQFQDAAFVPNVAVVADFENILRQRLEED
ncbi:hypothetical protein [Ruegeria meonggei]|uniref:Uncharacterized protein n=1 Tax=Ruegeria meonggei TaxID=1446476 RepID=A0A1X6Z3G3_9RHOB|nr:hypothetical protein [Ruegeria meonggei]SLN39797.1 hypothetical protein RUM8411_01787 [Ruegeria meonggei]